MKRSVFLGILCYALIALTLHDTATPQPATPDLAARLKVPPGFIVEVVAAPPLVHHPMMANFDERGRLFVAESSGLNLKADELLKQLPNKILMLDGLDAKGRFTKSRVFADKMTFPSGVLPFQGSVYVAAAPHIWKLTERLEKSGLVLDRKELVSKFNFIGNAADIHGPFLSPDGRLYWCDGRHGHEIKKPDGSVSKGKAARIFRCKTDGSEVEVVCGGGMDNPVEIAFTDEGEPLVTVDILHNQPSRNDGIIYAIEGGNYPWHEVSKEFPRTGDLLPAIENLGWVAPSGIMRYRSRAFGDEYRNNLFTAQFNRHRIQRHILERDGAGFKCKTEDFLTTDDKNFHPTDVFEDADGSMIVIDTGGWFRIGCPTSKIAQPEIKGAIYRVRKADVRSMNEDWTIKLRRVGVEWDRRFIGDLVGRDLYYGGSYGSLAIRDRAIEELARRGKVSIPNLQKTIELNPNNTSYRRDAIWVATRIDDSDARHFVRSYLNDKELTVKLAALHSVGLHRDAKAMPILLRIVAKDHPAAMRQAATALGRIKNAKAIPAIMEAVQLDLGDRFLEHALIYALIQIHDRDATAAYLNDLSRPVRRAALIALDQMEHGNLTREELAAQLNSDDKRLAKAALEIVAARPRWAGEITGLLRDWLKDADPARQESVRGLLLALSKEPTIQEIMVQSMRDAKTPRSSRLLLIETMGRAPLVKLPVGWLDELGKTLDQPDDALAQQAIAAIRARNLATFDKRLDRIVHDAKHSPETRVQAFGAVAARNENVDDAAFQFLVAQLQVDRPPLLRLSTAKGLGQAKLNDAQLLQLTKVIASAGPLELPALLATFEKNTSGDVGKALVPALEKNPSAISLTPGAVEQALRQFPNDIRKQAAKLIDRLQVDAGKQKTRLDDLETLTKGGSVEQGRDIFFGNKASCSACHAINNKGGGIGPDLGKIGAIRSSRDLLESIVFPSASFARGFETYVVETKVGKTHSGILARESTDAVHLLTTERVEVRIPRQEIEAFVPSRVSIMPQGLETQLSRRELQDLLAYLQGLR
jgi:putative heme-binding domain-containing protein